MRRVAAVSEPKIVVPVLGLAGTRGSTVVPLLRALGVDLDGPRHVRLGENAFETINTRLLSTRDGEAALTIEAALAPSFREYVRTVFTGTHFGWTDPRTVLTLAFWRRELARLGYDDIRPITVLESLSDRTAGVDHRPIPLEARIHAADDQIEPAASSEGLLLLEQGFLEPDIAHDQVLRCAAYLGLDDRAIGPALATLRRGQARGRLPQRIDDATCRLMAAVDSEPAPPGERAASVRARPSVDAACTPVHARRRDYCIYIVSPDGYSGAHAFDDLALCLHYAFQRLGFAVPIVRHPSEIDGIPIVLGAHLLDTLPNGEIPRTAVVYNLEQIAASLPWLNEGYIETLRQHVVWDYSTQNQRALAELGASRVHLCPIGFVPESEGLIADVPQEDIDILFYGSLNPRREAILAGLERRGANVTCLLGLYGLARDRLIERAKIVLNVHHYEAKVMEIVRLSHLLANQRFIVSERGTDAELEAPFETGVVFAAYGDLVDTCLRYLERPDERTRAAARGREIFARRDQVRYLRDALDATFSGRTCAAQATSLQNGTLR